MKVGSQMWPLVCSQGFHIIRTSDLVFDPTWRIFEFDRDFIEAIILSKICEDWTKNVASSVHKLFLWFDLATYFLIPLDPHSNLTEISLRQSFWACFMKIEPTCGLYSVHIFFYDLWPITHIQILQRYYRGNHSGQVLWRLKKKCSF